MPGRDQVGGNAMRSPSLLQRLAAAAALSAVVLAPLPAVTQNLDAMTVAQIMRELVAPTTTALWGAYDVQTEAQWQELESAASRLIQAGELLRAGGSAATDRVIAANEDWQEYSNQMVAASRSALEAIRNRNEDALSTIGNDDLYPPCESCHGKYMPK
jgi:cytochrome c556